MRQKPFLLNVLTLTALILTTFGSYRLGQALLPPSPQANGLPALSSLDLPPQTQNGITASLQGYYADATRFVFQVRLTGSSTTLSQVQILGWDGNFVNASASYGPAEDLSTYLVDFGLTTPLTAEHFNGSLDFAVVKSIEDVEPLAHFNFKLNVPIRPALIFEPKRSYQSVNGMKMLLDRVVLSPSSTLLYLCYTKPDDGDWGVSSETALEIDGQQAQMMSYSLLSDTDYNVGDEGGEPGWISPINAGRCVELGFPIGSANPHALTLTVPSLEQSMPEIIPDDRVQAALKQLRDWESIEMEWRVVDHGVQVEYKKLPAGMTEQQAYRKFVEALGYVYYGQWTFDVQLDPADKSTPRFTTSTYGMPPSIPLSETEPRVVAKLKGRIRAFDISPDLKTIAFATSNGVELYDLKSFQPIRALDGNAYLVAWSPDGSQLAAADIVKGGEFGPAHLAVWDTSTWKVIFEQTGKDETLDSIYGDIAWSPDGKLLADSVHGMSVLVHDIKTGETISQQDMLNSYELSWSPDGTRLVGTGDLAYGIRRWKVSTNESVRLFDQRSDSSLRVAWAPDGQRIASGHSNGAVCFWTAATNQCDGLIYAHANAVYSLTWSPDGNRLATGGGIIRIWDTHTGQLVTSFGEASNTLYTELQWPANAPLVSLQTGNGAPAATIVRFWDADTGQILYEFQGAGGVFGQ
jgi:WD40 repeat protein